MPRKINSQEENDAILETLLVKKPTKLIYKDYSTDKEKQIIKDHNLKSYKSQPEFWMFTKLG